MNASAAAAQQGPLSDLERRLVGGTGVCIAFLWGLAESTFFFVIPDVFLSLVALFDLKTTWRHILAAIAGAAVGGALLFHWSAVGPERARSAVARVPFVTQEMFDKVEGGFRKRGLLAVFLGSVSGVPYKLYAVEAPRYCDERDFLLATPPARAVRFVLLWLGFGFGARWLRSRGWTGRELVRVHAGIWIASYAVYWGRIVFR